MYMVVQNCIGCGSSGVEYERSDRDFLSLRGGVIFLNTYQWSEEFESCASLEYVPKIGIG